MATPAYYQVIEMSDLIQRTGVLMPNWTEGYEGNEYARTRTGFESFRLKDPFSQLTLTWLKPFSSSAKLFILDNIIHGLKKYNMLWHWPTPTKSQEKKVIKELIERKLIYRTETTGIYLVNPLMIWRGTVPGVVESTKKLLRDYGKPSIEMIRDLDAVKVLKLKTSEDQFNILNQ